MKYFIVNKSNYESLPEQDKKLVRGVSTSKDETQYAIHTLSGIDYYAIKARLEHALLTPLKDYTFHGLPEMQEIVDSGEYTEEPNLKTRDSEGKSIIRPSNVAVDEHLRVRHQGILKGTITAGATTDLDWKMDQLQYTGQDVPSIMTGVHYKVIGGEPANPVKTKFCIIDIDGIISPAGTVLDGFASDYYMFSDESSMMREHEATLYPGLYIRAHVNNPGNADCTFICNLLRYIDTTGV